MSGAVGYEANPKAEFGTPALMSIAARLEQLQAAVGEALAHTIGLTSYPHLQAATNDPPETEATVLNTIDRLNSQMADLNMRLTRVNDVVGGKL